MSAVVEARQEQGALKWLGALVVMGDFLIPGLLFAIGHKDYHGQLQRTVHERMTGAIKSSLENRVARCARALLGLKAFAVSYPTFSAEQFQEFADNILPDVPEIRCLQLAPGGIITHLHPWAGNEAAYGMNLRTDPEQSGAALEAIRTGETVVAGPLALKQGGNGLVFRMPIFTVDGGGRRFWGFAVAVVDFDQFMRRAGVTAQPGLEIALRGRNSTGEQGEVFFGDAAVYEKEPVTSVISLPSGSWQIALVPSAGWEAQPFWTVVIFVGVVCGAFIMGCGTWLILFKNEQLRSQVDEIKTLRGILPICSSCKNIRDDKGYWVQVEAYVARHTDASFTHGICPDCQHKLYGNEPWYRKLQK